MKKPDTSFLYETNEYGIQHHKVNVEIPDDVIEYYKENYNIKTDVHKTCISCQIRQLDKYPDQKDFIIPCKGIPRGLPPGSASKLDEMVATTKIPKEQARKILLATIDPAAWAELMFGFNDDDPKWKLRAYQKEQLRCSSKRIAIREGRRSGKTFMSALKLLYYAFNLKVNKGRDLQGNEVMLGPSIMIVTPYQAQLTTIFEEMEKLIKRNYELRSEVTSGTGDNLYVKTPTFKMEFKNQATIQGFVSGIGMRQDGSGGGTMRGQSADIVYLDEMDMIPKDVLDKVINPILATTPDTMLIATSTPIGKKSKFYEWCLERPDFKEDFHPSSVIPHWEQIKEEILRDSTKESFMAEYMAVFIDSEDGVFKADWIQKARVDYSYLDTTSSGFLANKLGIAGANNKSVAIGIDWNKNAGTEFFVVGYFPMSQMWVALDAVNIPHEEYSARKWISELIKLNYKWKPNYIYADEGYGHTIIEDLRYEAYKLRQKPNKSAIDLETVLITDRLTAFNFSKMVELKDPVNEEVIKKPGKNFLVENIQRIFEDSNFIFPADDEKLRAQLQNYMIVKRHPSTGKPIYGMNNERIGDHRLDALMLALGALVLEESVYAGKSNMLSVPTFHKKNDRADSYISPHDEADRKLDEMIKKGYPGHVNILKIMRGGSEQEDKAVKDIYKQDGLPAYQSNKSNKNRDLNKQKEVSILEGIENWKNNPSQNTMTSFGVSTKRGKFGSKNRSW